MTKSGKHVRPRVLIHFLVNGRKPSVCMQVGDENLHFSRTNSDVKHERP